MVQLTRQPSLLESASDAVGSGFERARGVIDIVAERAGEAVDGIDVDAVRAAGREAIGNLQVREPGCSTRVEAARDDERFKSAVIAGVVIFMASLIAFVLAREAAKRRAEATERRAAQRRSQRALDRPESAVNQG
jgi:hypothetical protein